MLINLRGVRESGTIFAIPTYFFVAMMFVTVGIGIVRYLTGTLGVVSDPPPMEALGGPAALSLFLILRAFSSGTTALTGVEAIANGVPAFKEPRSRNAGVTLLVDGRRSSPCSWSPSPSCRCRSERFRRKRRRLSRSLPARSMAERGILYLLTMAGTTIILIMAANTSYNGFPRLGALLAIDGFLPQTAFISGQPAGLLARHRGAGAIGLRLHRRLRRKCHPADPTLRHRRLSLVQSFAGRHGTALVEVGAAAPVGDADRARLNVAV